MTTLLTLLSESTRDLLERLRPHLDVGVEVFDEGLSPVLPDSSAPLSLTLRSLAGRAHAAAHDETGEALAVAMRTGRHRMLTVDDVRVGLFPVRHGPRVVALLAAAAPLPRADEAAGLTRDETVASADRRIERFGWALRTTIEADIVKGERLSAHERRSLWLGSVLRFLDHLHGCTSSREVLEAIIQAAAIWGDVDARVYRAQLDEGYVLDAWLPAAARGPATLPASLPGLHLGPLHVRSIPELEHLGFDASDGEVLLLPLPPTGPAEWLLSLTGPLDAEFTQVLTTIAHTAATLLERLALAERRQLHDRLLSRLSTPGLRLPAQAAALLAELASTVGATGARLLVREAEDGPPRVLAQVGEIPGGSATVDVPPDGLATTRRLGLRLDIGLPTPALIDLWTSGTPFASAACHVAEAGAAMIEVWLGGALSALGQADATRPSEAARAFEGRLAIELRRAREANLAAGLLVIDVAGADTAHSSGAEAAATIVRGQLRASDLVGQLAGGEVAALVVAATPASVDAVAERVARRLESCLPQGDTPFGRLGRAAFPSAGETATALVSAARHDLARHHVRP